MTAVGILQSLSSSVAFIIVIVIVVVVVVIIVIMSDELVRMRMEATVSVLK